MLEPTLTDLELYARDVLAPIIKRGGPSTDEEWQAVETYRRMKAVYLRRPKEPIDFTSRKARIVAKRGGVHELV